MANNLWSNMSNQELQASSVELMRKEPMNNHMIINIINNKNNPSQQIN